MALPALSSIILLCIALPLLALSEWQGIWEGHMLFKMTSSVAFILAALLSPPWERLFAGAPLEEDVKTYVFLLTAAFFLSACGDYLLVPDRKTFDGGVARSRRGSSTSTPPPTFSRPQYGTSSLALEAEEEEEEEDDEHDVAAEESREDGSVIWFQLGMLAFMLAHVGLIVAFLTRYESYLSTHPEERSSNHRLIWWAKFLAGLFGFLALGTYLGFVDLPDFGRTLLTPVIGPPHPISPKSIAIETPEDEAAPLIPTSTSLNSKGPFNIAIPSDMIIPINVYAVAIAAMLASSLSTITPSHSSKQQALGAVLFVVSDVFVACDVFGLPSPGSRNSSRRGSAAEIPETSLDRMTRWYRSKLCGRGRKRWKGRVIGWVFYFGAQMVLAGALYDLL